MTNNVEYKEIMAFHPGYYIQETIEELEITQEEFAIRLGTTAKTISKLVNGEINLSNDIAHKLSNMLGTSVELWLNLQTAYEKKLIEINEARQLDQQKSIVYMIDYKYFVDLGLVTEARKIEDKITNLRRFFQISSLDILLTPDFLVNYRTATQSFNDKNIINSRAWLQTAINIGRNMQVANFDAKKLKSYLPEIRSMTLQSPQVFLPRLKEIFSKCGVTFVLLPYLKNSGVNGAVKWINKDKVILALNDRRKSADTFWFSLFHEIKHVLQQKHKQIFISGQEINTAYLNEQLEAEADKFAQETLIPEKLYQAFINNRNFSDPAIISFAKQIGIHPGIIFGRLQHDNHLAQNRGALYKVQYTIIA